MATLPYHTLDERKQRGFLYFNQRAYVGHRRRIYPSRMSVRIVGGGVRAVAAGLSLAARFLRLWIRPDIGEAENVSRLAPAVMPSLAAGLTIQRRLQLPHWRVRRLLQGSQRHQRNPVAAIAFGYQEIASAVDGFADRRLGLGGARRRHGRT